ncbi:MAG: hypothetical protein ACK5SX_05930, partial [Sandaracinobacter sp.]
RQRPRAKIHRKRSAHPCRPPSPASILNQTFTPLGIPADSNGSENALIRRLAAGTAGTQKGRGHSLPFLRVQRAGFARAFSVFFCFGSFLSGLGGFAAGRLMPKWLFLSIEIFHVE